MTKAELIKHMEDYEDDDDLIVLWWDIHILEGILQYPKSKDHVLDDDLIKRQWEELVKEVEEYDFQQANEEVIEIIQSVIMGG